MSEQSLRRPWAAEGWLQRASTWIHTELERHGIGQSGPIERAQASRANVLRVPSTAGDIFFKASEPALAHEPALTVALSRWRPDCMPPILSADLKRGWTLIPDLGETLRTIKEPARVLEHWRRALPLFAEVQIDLVSRADEVLALGGLDRRLVALPDHFEQLLADIGRTLLDQPNGINNEEYLRLRRFGPELRAVCQRLADYGIPETLHHEDLHDANIYLHDGGYTFADWGESGVAHPFCTLLVTSRVIAWRLELASDAPELVRLRDIYLEPWTRLASREDLIAALKLAYRVGMLCRALTWHRLLAGAEESARPEYVEAAAGWLLEFLNEEAASPE